MINQEILRARRMNWLDLAADRARLGIMVLPSNARVLAVFMGRETSTTRRKEVDEALRPLGFVMMRSTEEAEQNGDPNVDRSVSRVWVSKVTETLPVASLMKVFPGAVRAEMPMSEVVHVINRPGPTPELAQPEGRAGDVGVPPGEEEDLLAEALGDDDEIKVNGRELVDFGPGIEEAESVAIQIENSLQSQYIPMSKAPGTTMVPRNLAAATLVAQNRFRLRNGEADAFLMAQTGWTEEQMRVALEPEQIDAVVMSLDADARGVAMTLGDAPGVGKGRVVATRVLVNIRQGRRTIFLTETPNLFSALWRDLEDIGAADQVRPFVVNFGEEILGYDSQVKASGAYRLGSRAQREDGTRYMLGIPEGANVAFCSYSQLNRGPTSIRARLLANWVAGQDFIGDEIHNAAGNSNISASVDLIRNAASSRMYSSATYAKRPESFAFYAPTLGIRQSNRLVATLRSGGESLQEVFAAMLVEDGVLLRREHDISNIEYVTVEDTARLERNRLLADRFADVYSALIQVLSRGREKMAVSRALDEALDEAMEGGGELNQLQEQRAAESQQGPGGGLRHLSLLFTLAIKADLVADRAVAALQEGCKPVIYIEHTMETQLREIEARIAEHGMEGILSNALREAEIDLRVDVAHLRFRDVLLIQSANFFGLSAENTVDDLPPRLRAVWDVLSKMIEEFPDIPVSPIDHVRERIEAEGYHVGELSGRDRRRAGGVIEKMPEISRTDLVDSFNNGAPSGQCDVVPDALILTNAGTTGISLHASSRVGDQRRRVLIKAEIPNDVTRAVQVDGRVNRRNQVSSPRVETTSTGLPMEAYLASSANRRLRGLNANVSSNRESIEVRDAPDLINEIGDSICKDFLALNTDIAERLCIPPSKYERENQDDFGEVEEVRSAEAIEKGLANMLMARLVGMPVSVQERVLHEITSQYESTLADLDRRGINPLRAKSLPGRYEIEKQELYSGSLNDATESAFLQPVWLTTLKGWVEVTPMSLEAVMAMIDKSYTEIDRRGMTPIRVAGWLQANADRILADVLPQGYGSTAEAIEALQNLGRGRQSPAEQAFLKKRRDLQYLINSLPKLQLGARVQFSGFGSSAQSGYLTKITVPPRHSLGEMSQWKLEIASPGDEKPTLHSLSVLRSDRNFGIQTFVDMDRMATEFDAAPTGRVPKVRKILSGNQFEATSLLTENRRIGQPVTWVDMSGARHRAIEVARADYLSLRPVRFDRHHRIISVMKALAARPRHLAGNAVVFDADGQKLDLRQPGVFFDRDGVWRLQLPTQKERQEQPEIYESPEMAAIMELRGKGNRRVVKVTEELAQTYLDVMYAHGHKAIGSSVMREIIVDLEAREIAERLHAEAEARDRADLGVDDNAEIDPIEATAPDTPDPSPAQLNPTEAEMAGAA